MKAEGLRAARIAQRASAIVGVVAALAGAGFALTGSLFPAVRPDPTTTVGTTVTVGTTPTTAPSTTTKTEVADISSSGVWTVIGAVFGLSIVIAAAMAALALGRRRLRRRVDRDIATVADARASVDSVTQSVLDREGTHALEGELVRQRAGRHLVDTHARAALEVELLDFLPRRPRSVKRAVNDLLLRIAMAVQSDLLTERSAVHATELAKWVVLCHRWPELAAAIEKRPGLLDELEEVTDQNALGAELRRASIATANVEELYAFMRHEPQLARVLGALTLFDAEPASTRGLS